MNMKQLRYFLAVAEELNFTRAAAKVNIAQPPLSQQIMALEAELGTPLFRREKRKVELTSAGLILVEHAHRVLNAASAAVAAVRAAERGANAKLSIGAVYSSIYAFMPETLRLFRTIEPRTEVSIQEMTIDQQISALREGKIEIGILRGNLYDREIVTEQLFRERLILAVHEKSALLAESGLTVDRVSQLPLIAVSRTPIRGYADRILNIFEQEELKPHIMTEVSDMHTSICMVAAGLGSAIVPSTMRLLQPRGVRFIPIDSAAAHISFSLAWRAEEITSSMAAFLDSARQNAKDMINEYSDLFLPLPDARQRAAKLRAVS
ncbi:LysR family transcriptional regulator [Paracoccus sp. J55]|uniref:LysR family transcriptional regulator n=1 Tax=Paracoccus sp. J55 TaxID=935849 RepID=UPI0004AFD016|nr:LysR family transcriptional regulator [Paracoccus sp. J55]